MGSNFLIPGELYKQITKSGYFRNDSPYRNTPLKGLFLSPPNEKYLQDGVYRMVTNKEYVDMHGVGNKALILKGFRANEALIKDSVRDLMDMHVLPHSEDLFVASPVQQLNLVNRDFLVKTTRNMLSSPDMIIPDFYGINPETGADERETNWDYGASSYADGTWHPEHLFTNSERNRKNLYWVPEEINYDARPEATGLGHRYNSPVYARTPRTRSQFPRWQYSVDHRNYDRHNGESLAEGGISDRRVQRPSGYNTANLRYKSTY